MTKSRSIIKNKPFRIIGFIILLLYSFTLIFALCWALLNSMKNDFEFMMSAFDFPSAFDFQNYKIAFENLKIPTNNGDVHFMGLLKNSVLYTLLYTFIPLFGNIFVAYGCARYNSKIGKIINTVVVLRLIVPIVGGLSSGLQISKYIGTYDNMLFASIMQFTPQGATYLILYATFKGISKEYSEAAFIDGASHMNVFLNIVLPLAKNVIVALSISSFIGCWNDWQTAMVWFPSYPTLAYGLYTFQSSSGNTISSPTVQFAGSMVVMLPMLILFIFTKDQLVGNLTMGGLKG